MEPPRKRLWRPALRGDRRGSESGRSTGRVASCVEFPQRPGSGRKQIGLNSHPLEHRDEQSGQRLVVLFVEGEVARVTESAATQSAAKEHHCLVDERAGLFIDVVKRVEHVPENSHFRLLDPPRRSAYALGAGWG